MGKNYGYASRQLQGDCWRVKKIFSQQKKPIHFLMTNYRYRTLCLRFKCFMNTIRKTRFYGATFIWTKNSKCAFWLEICTLYTPWNGMTQLNLNVISSTWTVNIVMESWEGWFWPSYLDNKVNMNYWGKSLEYSHITLYHGHPSTNAVSVPISHGKDLRFESRNKFLGHLSYGNQFLGPIEMGEGKATKHDADHTL